MISHSARGGRCLLRTGLVATTRTKAKRLSISSPFAAVRQGSRFHAFLGSRSASARSDSGFRSGRGTDRRRPTLPLRSGTAKVVVVAVGSISENRRERDLPAGRLRAETAGKLRLRLKADLDRDLRSLPAQLVRTPLLRQIQ